MQIWNCTCEPGRRCRPEARQCKPRSDLEASDIHQGDGSVVMGRASCKDSLQALFASLLQLSFFFFFIFLLTPLVVGATAVCEEAAVLKVR